MQTRLWFARHGEVEARYVGSFIGTTDVQLSPLGRHQAEALAAYLADAQVDAIVSSPRKRALDTAAPLAKAKGMKLDVRNAFAEMDFGAWEGLFWPDIQAKAPDAATRWQNEFMTMSAPDGETGAAFAARVAAGVDALKTEFKGRTVAVFGHAGTSRAILGATVGRPYDEMLAYGQDYGNLSAVGFGGDGVGQVALWNFVPGPRSEKQGS